MPVINLKENEKSSESFVQIKNQKYQIILKKVSESENEKENGNYPVISSKIISNPPTPMAMSDDNIELIALLDNE